MTQTPRLADLLPPLSTPLERGIVTTVEATHAGLPDASPERLITALSQSAVVNRFVLWQFGLLDLLQLVDDEEAFLATWTLAPLLAYQRDRGTVAALNGLLALLPSAPTLLEPTIDIDADNYPLIQFDATRPAIRIASTADLLTYVVVFALALPLTASLVRTHNQAGNFLPARWNYSRWDHTIYGDWSGIDVPRLPGVRIALGKRLLAVTEPARLAIDPAARVFLAFGGGEASWGSPPPPAPANPTLAAPLLFVRPRRRWGHQQPAATAETVTIEDTHWLIRDDERFPMLSLRRAYMFTADLVARDNTFSAATIREVAVYATAVVTGPGPLWSPAEVTPGSLLAYHRLASPVVRNGIDRLVTGLAIPTR